MKKTITLLLLTAVLILSLIFASVSASAKVLGDVDENGVLEVVDATYIQRHLADLEELSESRLQAGKVENGVTLTVVDATLIQQKLADIIDFFPIENASEPTETPSSENPTDAPTAAPTSAPTSAPTAAPTQPPTEKETVPKVKDTITVYFSNNKNWSKVNAYIYNNATGTPQSAWPGTQMTYVKQNDMGESVYQVSVDTKKYDRIIFNNGSAQTTDTPITKSNSGYFINGTVGSKYIVGLYPYGQNGEGSLKTVSMEYSSGYNKNIYIWLPEGYNAADKTKKYSVLYMCDGQNLFGQMTTLSGYEWECDESVLSLMQNGGDGVIVVGVDNSNNKRDSELTPNLGPLSDIAGSSFRNGTGAVYCDFVVHKVVPYIESHYNVNSVRGIAGSSSGGIEAFYIGMENPEIFDYIGALSPAFLLFDKPVWDSYLSKKDFSNNVARIYFFCGNGDDQLEKMLYTDSVAMEGWLKTLGYPADKMMTVADNDGVHSEAFWAVYFPEMLSFGLDI